MIEFTSLPPSIDHLGVLIFKPPKALLDRPLDFAFNRVSFVTSQPFLPLEFRVMETPRFSTVFLDFPVLYLWWRRRIGSTVWPEIIRPGGGGGRRRRSIVFFYLHHVIAKGRGSVFSSHGLGVGWRMFNS